MRKRFKWSREMKINCCTLFANEPRNIARETQWRAKRTAFRYEFLQSFRLFVQISYEKYGNTFLEAACVLKFTLSLRQNT